MIFLHSFRAALIPIVTIPVSLITTFAIMYAAGLTINTLTLLAMVLAIGLVVDDAIVMLENIYRHIEKGMKPFDAAIKGAREIGFADRGDDPDAGRRLCAGRLHARAHRAPVPRICADTRRRSRRLGLRRADADADDVFASSSSIPRSAISLRG